MFGLFQNYPLYDIYTSQYKDDFRFDDRCGVPRWTCAAGVAVWWLLAPANSCFISSQVCNTYKFFNSFLPPITCKIFLNINSTVLIKKNLQATLCTELCKFRFSQSRSFKGSLSQLTVIKHFQSTFRAAFYFFGIYKFLSHAMVANTFKNYFFLITGSANSL